MVGDWENFLAEEQEETLNDIRKHERTGRPLGTAGFVGGRGYQHIAQRSQSTQHFAPLRETGF